MEHDRPRPSAALTDECRLNGSPDRRYFAGVAADTGFRAEPLETVFRLVRLLDAIRETLPGTFALRGGTALNVFHLDAPRLSVDIDLDFTGCADSMEARARRPEVLASLAALAERNGYRVGNERESYALAHLRLGYHDINARPAFLALDINFLDRVPVNEPEYREARHVFGDDLGRITFPTHTLAELAAGKVIALARRALARDLFDVAMLAALPELDVTVARTVMVVRGAGYPPPSPADYSLESAAGVRLNRWRSEVVALCRRPVPFGLEDARLRAGGLLEAMFDLGAGHHAFLTSLERGDLRAELLGEPALTSRIERNPGLLRRIKVGVDALEDR